MKNATCEEKIRNVLDGIKNVKIIFANVEQERIVLEIGDGCPLTLVDLQNKIETEADIRTVIKGIGENFSLISEVKGDNNLIGVVRLSQISESRCLVDGVIDNVKLNHQSNHCSINIHQFGNLSGNQFEHVGKFYVKIADDIIPHYGKCRIRKEIESCDLANLIGRSLLISEKETSQHKGAGILARMSTIEGNVKKICSCSGKTIWEERDDHRYQIFGDS